MLGLSTTMGPTEDQLRDAWRAIAEPDWGEFDVAKKAVLHYALARLRAGLIARSARVGAAPADVHVPAVAAPPQPRRQPAGAACARRAARCSNASAPPASAKTRPTKAITTSASTAGPTGNAHEPHRPIQPLAQRAPRPTHEHEHEHEHA